MKSAAALVLLAACSSSAKPTATPIVAAEPVDAAPTRDAASPTIEDPRVLVALAAPGWRTRAHVAVAAGAAPHVAPGEPWPGWVAYDNREHETLPVLGEEDDWVLVGMDAHEQRVVMWIARDQLLPVATRATPIVANGAKPAADDQPGAFALPGFVFPPTAETNGYRARRAENLVVDGLVSADDVGWKFEPTPGLERDAHGWTWGDARGRIVDRKGKKGRVIAQVDGFVRVRELTGGAVEILDAPSKVAWDDSVLVRGVLDGTFEPFDGPGYTVNFPPGDVAEGTCLVAGGRLVGVAGVGLNRSTLWTSSMPTGSVPFELDEALGCSQLVTPD